MRPALKRGLRWGLTAAVIALLVAFARDVDWGATWHALRTADLRLLVAATIVNFVSLLVKGVRWWIFLRAAGAPSLGLAMRATVAGAGLNNVLVANGGEAARVLFVSRATGIGRTTVLASLALERLFDVVAFVMLLLGAALLLPLPGPLQVWRWPAGVVLVLLVAGLAWLARPRAHPEAEAVAAAAAAATLRERVRAHGVRFARSVGALSSGPRFAGALLASALSWAGQGLTYDLTARAVHFPLPAAGTVAALLATNLGFAIRATPGAVGIFQFAYALAAVQFGLPRDPAIATAFLLQTLQILPVTILGVALAPQFVMRRRSAREAVAHDDRAV